MAQFTPRIDSHTRNLIINGNFDYWQRGISSSAIGYGTADRWLQSFSGYTQTLTRSTDVPTLTQSGYQSQYSLLLTNGTGATPTAAQYQQIIYRLEGFDYQNIHARKARLQFWVKSSVVGTYAITLLGNVIRSLVTTYSITSANTWQKVNLDITFDNFAGYVFDNTRALQIIFALTAGSNNQQSTLNTWQSVDVEGATVQTQWGATTGATFQLAQVMLVPEDLTNTATNVDITFQRAGRTIQQELAMCQRYFQYYDVLYFMGVSTPNNEFRSATFPLPVVMRATASLAYTDEQSNASKFTIRSSAANTVHNNGFGAFNSGPVYMNYTNAGNITAGASAVLDILAVKLDAEL